MGGGGEAEKKDTASFAFPRVFTLRVSEAVTDSHRCPWHLPLATGKMGAERHIWVRSSVHMGETLKSNSGGHWSRENYVERKQRAGETEAGRNMSGDERRETQGARHLCKVCCGHQLLHGHTGSRAAHHKGLRLQSAAQLQGTWFQNAWPCRLRLLPLLQGELLCRSPRCT